MNQEFINTRFTSVDYIPIFTEVIQFDSYNKIEGYIFDLWGLVFCSGVSPILMRNPIRLRVKLTFFR